MQRAQTNVALPLVARLPHSKLVHVNDAVRISNVVTRHHHLLVGLKVRPKLQRRSALPLALFQQLNVRVKGVDDRSRNADRLVLGGRKLVVIIKLDFLTTLITLRVRHLYQQTNTLPPHSQNVLLRLLALTNT